MKRKINRKKNRGFSLIELLVAIAILSIVMGAATFFFMRSIDSYHKSNAESDLQNEAQMTMAQLENLIVNASQGVGLDPSLPVSQTTDDELYVYNRDDSAGSVKYVVTHIYKDGDKLKYNYRDYVQSGGTYGLSTVYGEQTFSNFIGSFTVDVSKLVSKNSVDFSIDFRGRNNRKYKTNNTVLLRNKVLDKTNGGAADYFAESIQEDEKIEVTKLEVSPKEFSMWAGTSAACPFTVTYYKSVNNNYVVSDKGTAVWNIFRRDQTVDTLVDGADINRATGAISLRSDVTGDLTVRATEQSSIDRSGTNEGGYIYDEATVHVKSAGKAELTTPTQQSDNLSVATAIFTIRGENLTEADLNLITPVVASGSSPLSVSIVPDPASSSSDALCYTVKINRPTNYLGKEYSLIISATLPGNKIYAAEVKWEFAATPGDDTKVISAVKLADTSGRVSSEAGSVSVAADRGDQLTMVMYVKYKDQDGNETDYTPLAADAWSIQQSSGTSSADTTCSIVPGAADYTLFVSAQDYSRDLSMDFTTKYSDGDGTEKTGPSLHLTFSRVRFHVKDVVGDQSVFPVTAGKTQNIQFEVQGLKNGSVYVKEGSSTGISVTASGQTASVSVRQNAIADVDYTFGLRDSKGHVINNVTCEITIWPEKANSSDGIYIPSVSDISNFDPTKDAPEAGRQTTIFMPDGERVTYRNQPRVGVDGETHRYWAEYNGKTYYWVSNLRRWVLNE